MPFLRETVTNPAIEALVVQNLNGDSAHLFARGWVVFTPLKPLSFVVADRASASIWDMRACLFSAQNPNLILETWTWNGVRQNIPLNEMEDVFGEYQQSLKSNTKSLQPGGFSF